MRARTADSRHPPRGDDQTRCAISPAPQTSGLARTPSSLPFPREWVADSARTGTLLGCLVAIVCRALAVLGSQRALLGRFRTVLSGSPALLDGGHHDIAASKRALVVLPLTGTVALHHRHVARVGRPVSLRRRTIPGSGDLVTRGRSGQTHPRALITLIARPIALIGRVRAHATAVVVLAPIAAGGEVAIAGRLILIGRHLVAVSAGLVAVGARLIGV